MYQMLYTERCLLPFPAPPSAPPGGNDPVLCLHLDTLCLVLQSQCTHTLSLSHCLMEKETYHNTVLFLSLNTLFWRLIILIHWINVPNLIS